ncbi:1,4-dihydroxy-2-naphthoate polyprenyltransferase, partial [Halobacteriales archaeon QH_1_68_42]
FAPVPWLAALVGALLIQVGTNFANDYYDAVKGADTDEREGFTRVTAGGLIPPRRVKLAMAATYGLAVLVGVYLVAVGGAPILVVNNIRDRETDAAAGKRTLAVILGYRWGRVEYLLLMGMAYVVPVVFALDPAYGLPALAPLASLPLAASVSKTVVERTDGEALNPALERVGQTLFAHSLLFAAGLAAPAVELPVLAAAVIA